jgi:hypothetical protein
MNIGVETKIDITLVNARTSPANKRIKNVEADKKTPSFILKGIITRPSNIRPAIKPMIFINFS